MDGGVQLEVSLGVVTGAAKLHVESLESQPETVGEYWSMMDAHYLRTVEMRIVDFLGLA